jgi:uncharacterized membrane protein YhaH (DUF805 family)
LPVDVAKDRVREIVTTWFSLSRPVDRKFYAASGFGLIVAKYAIDSALVFAATGAAWTPLGYIHPSLGMRQSALGAPFPTWLFWAIVAWTLPFYWIGASMTMRRAQDAGLGAGWGLLFFMPIVNYLFMLVLCALPSRPAAPAAESVPAGSGGALRGAAGGALVGILMMALSVLLLRGYGASLFLGTPFVMGFVAGFLANRDTPRTPTATLGVAYLAILVVAGAIALGALEGLICMLMALPLALAAASVGALIGRQVALGHRETPAVAMLLVALPLLTGFESLDLRGPLREVATAVEIAAPPEAVWPNVVAFSELAPPSELVFSLGIAYPIRARISGHGPGAVRTCEFSTGAFVEPITVWDEPRRLAFSVASQPPPMQEWSPYRHVAPPHLVNGLVSERGEFRLVPLAGSRTRLEGSTWYRQNLFPQLYWTRWSDALIHAIHRRVLEHIQREVERRVELAPGRA